jgi:hypothetical protein
MFIWEAVDKVKTKKGGVIHIGGGHRIYWKGEVPVYELLDHEARWEAWSEAEALKRWPRGGWFARGDYISGIQK